MHGHGDGPQTENACPEQLFLPFHIGQARANDHSAQTVHQAGGQTPQRRPAQRHRRQVLDQNGGVLQNGEPNAHRHGYGQDHLPVIAEEEREHQHRQRLQDLLHDRGNGLCKAHCVQSAQRIENGVDLIGHQCRCHAQQQEEHQPPGAALQNRQHQSQRQGDAQKDHINHFRTPISAVGSIAVSRTQTSSVTTGCAVPGRPGNSIAVCPSPSRMTSAL